MTRHRFFVLVLAYCIVPHQAHAEKITLAVASNFTGAMKEIAAAFEQQSGHQVDLVFGSSGKFAAQISNGAPFQAFFSADQAKPVALENNGLAVPGSRFTYAMGTLALWSADPGLIDGHSGVPQRLPVERSFNKLAMANPKLAPYGAAALAVLRALQLEAATRGQWVQGENIAQTYQFVASGNADIGFVALSQILAKGDETDGEVKEGSAWIVPETLHPPIRQDAVLLRRGEDSPATREFLMFVRSEKAAGIIQSHGYRIDNSPQP